jgi:hypothetical protein
MAHRRLTTHKSMGGRVPRHQLAATTLFFRSTVCPPCCGAFFSLWVTQKERNHVTSGKGGRTLEKISGVTSVVKPRLDNPLTGG